MLKNQNTKTDTGFSLLRSLFLRMAALAVMVGFITRIVLTCNISVPSGSGLGIIQTAAAFAIGTVNDFCVAAIGFAFLWLFSVCVTRKKYARPYGYILLGILTAVTVGLCALHTSLDDFGRGFAKVIKIILAYWTLTFALRLFIPRIRKGWTRFWFGAIISLYVLAIFFNAVSEYFFWAEFNVRYNFIAVDYLIYTQEVIGNILESYSLFWPSVALIAVTAVTTAVLFRKPIAKSDLLYGHGWRIKASTAYICVAALGVLILRWDSGLRKSDNVYFNELQANGLYSFYQAFLKKELDFDKFYFSIGAEKACATVRGIYGSTDGNMHSFDTDSVKRRPNIIVLMLESMSAGYMERYGNTEHLTPNLDSIAGISLTFDRAFATGNRTVRGLESVTLSLPPSAGESIVKRKDNKGFVTTASVLAGMGYTPFFFYGGNAYFDNMGDFFGGNGYTVVDKSAFTPDEITFSNIWGVCDEDSYTKVIRTIDSHLERNPGSPVFAHIMSVSNHRPYTYPAGRITVDPATRQRRGGVMYADYAVGKFLRDASEKPWFDNTVFVIMADHCASSAGSTELPLENYHIPAMIHAPGHIAPASIGQTVSQIDIIPTLLSLLGMKYEAPFFGSDVLSADYSPRAFVATYQDLGYLEGDVFTVLSPVKRVRQFRVAPVTGNPLNIEPAAAIDSAMLHRASALYQASAVWSAAPRR